MKTLLTHFLLLLSIVVHAQTVIPIGHAHNDYKQRHPLDAALSFGFTSIEVDVFLVDKEIKVAHTKLGLPFAKNLKDLYLDPLKERLDGQEAGVYGDSSILVLMIDLKNNRWELLDMLENLLKCYEDLLVHNQQGELSWAPLQILVSGGPPMQWINAQRNGFIFADWPLKGSYEESDRSSYCTRRSARWSDYFEWNGKGPISEEELVLLEKLTTETHSIGQKVRFWGIPETEACWSLLLEYEVDWINVDALEEFALYYRANHLK